MGGKLSRTIYAQKTLVHTALPWRLTPRQRSVHQPKNRNNRVTTRLNLAHAAIYEEFDAVHEAGVGRGQE